MNKLLIDIGSTYFKVCDKNGINQYFRNFDKDIFDDLSEKCSDTIEKYNKEDIYICSSANGGLSALIIGLTNSFSIKYATNIAFNSGINIIDTILYSQINETAIPSETIDVVIVVGGIDSVSEVFGNDLFEYLKKIKYQNIVYVGSEKDADLLQKKIKSLKVLGNIITNKLHVNEESLKEYLTNLYQEDIIGKEDIKHLYDLTNNQIYSTPYIVNRSLPHIDQKLDTVDPFIVVDIGGATTDIHYSSDLCEKGILSENEYNRLVFKKLGVYKSRESLIYSAKNNEFVYELLSHIDSTENILEEKSDEALKILMQLSVFLVLYKVSSNHNSYVNLKLNVLNSIILTGGITKVLSFQDIEDIVHFFYKKILNSKHAPKIIIDKNYEIWTLGMENK